MLGASECLDLAVIQLDKGTYPFLGWYEGEIKTALDVYSAGFPLGDPNFTLTKGIVSKADVPQEDSWASLDHVIEHDARIRGGNSGGPLVDPTGRVVGVNYAGQDELDYNFAIHRDQVLPYLEQLTKGERVLSLGVNAQALAHRRRRVGIRHLGVVGGGRRTGGCRGRRSRATCSSTSRASRWAPTAPSRTTARCWRRRVSTGRWT